MPEIKLSKRLAAIAALIPEGGGAADIGTDHGYIPVWLCQRGKNVPVLAGDINAEPLERAAATAREYGLEGQIGLRLCAGLSGFDASEVRTAVIAGMGGETIISILSDAPWTKSAGKCVVLQPMTKAAELRTWLYENGYRVTAERLVSDGRLYELFSVCGGEDEPYSPAQAQAGHFELIKGDPLLQQRLNELISKAQRAADGIRGSAAADAARLSELSALIAELSEMKGRIL